MESDVRRLFDFMGLSRHRYHEVMAEAAREAAAARWPLLAAIDRLLAATPPGRPERGRPDQEGGRSR